MQFVYLIQVTNFWGEKVVDYGSEHQERAQNQKRQFETTKFEQNTPESWT